MIKPISKETNRKNLIEVSSILNESDIEYSVFYGTALGIQREGDILPHDDDIDFIVKDAEIDKISSLFTNRGFVKTVYFPGLFLQISRNINGETSFVDFYSYREDVPGILIDRWNFRGYINRPETYLHIPKELLIPMKEFNYHGHLIRVPNNIDEICSFLYGPRYREKLIKDVDYITQVKDNKPNITYIK